LTAARLVDFDAWSRAKVATAARFGSKMCSVVAETRGGPLDPA